MTIARVSASFSFEAAHFSPEWPDDHPNHRMHGHSYMVELVAEGPIVDTYGGTVVSCERLSAIADAIKPLLDHRVLNQIEGLPWPTMEYLAAWILDRARLNVVEVVSVRVSRPVIGLWAEVTAEPAARLGEPE